MNPALAEESNTRKGFYLSSGIGKAHYQSSEINFDSSDVFGNWEYESNDWQFKFGVGYDFGNIRTEFEYGKDTFEYEDYSQNGADSTATGDLDLTTKSIRAFYDFNSNSKLSPYVGYGYGKSTYKNKGGTAAGDTTKIHTTDMDSQQLIIGATYELNQRSEIYTELSYEVTDNFRIGQNVHTANHNSYKQDGFEKIAMFTGLRYRF